MQSLLSTIHSSLSQTRSAFALRVFVSYDALGRCKQSVVVDIEQPRPPTFPAASRHTIRILTPAAPLRAAPLHTQLASPSPVPVTVRPSTLLSSHSSASSPHPQSTHALPSIACVNGSLPPAVAASPLPVRPPPAPAAPSPVSSLPAAVASPALFHSSSARSPTHSAGLLPAAPPSPSSAASPEAALTLPPHGAASAVDVEMGSRGDAPDGESYVPGSGSGSAQSPSSGASSGEGCTPAASRSAHEREKMNRKRRERKQRAKARAKEHMAEEVDRSREEKEDDDDARSHTSDYGAIPLVLPARLLSHDALKAEYAGRLAVAQGSGGVVSIGTYRKLQALMEQDIQLLEGVGRDWASEYQQQKPARLYVCCSDADLPLVDDDYCSDDDVKAMDVL
jgi:hypothetical protein